MIAVNRRREPTNSAMQIDGRSHRVRRRVGCIPLALCVAVVLAASATPAAAVVAERPDATWQADGPVFAVARAGDRIYLAGNFRHLVNGRGGSVRRTRLAALDASTGAPVASWTPSANHAVRGIAPSADGSRVFIGGDFTRVDGKARNGMAAVRASNGEVVRGWAPAARGVVHDVAVYGSTVYVAGSFGGIGGVSQGRLAALQASSGSVVRRFDPDIDGGVHAVSISPDGGVLYLVGDFSHVGGAYRHAAAAVDPTTGSVMSWSPNPGYPILDVVASGSTIYVAGAGSGGTLGAFDAVPGDGTAWEVHTDGNLQAIGFIGSTVYAGGHFDRVGAATRHKIFAVRAAGGDLLPWNPGMNSSVGVRSVLGYGNKLYVGGDFTVVNGSDREGFAAFTDRAR